MTYATTSDLYNAVPEAKLRAYVDDEGDGSQVDSRLNSALNRATDEIDAYLEGIYELPLDPVPERARDLCVDIAIFHIFSRVMEEPSETRLLRYNNAVSFLNKVRDGEVALVLASTGEEVVADSSVKMRLYAI